MTTLLQYLKGLLAGFCLVFADPVPGAQAAVHVQQGGYPERTAFIALRIAFFRLCCAQRTTTHPTGHAGDENPSSKPPPLGQHGGLPAVTSAAGTLNVSTQALSYSVNVTSIVGSPAVTSGAGILNVSTQTLPGGFSGNVNVTSIAGSAVVTSAAGVLNVSTQTIDKTGYNATTTVNLDKTGYSVTGLNAALLDISVSSRLAAASYSAPDNTGIANVSSVVNNALTESYRSNGGTGTIAQLMYEIVAHMGETSITGTTKTINKLDHATAAETFQLDSSSTPAAIKRIT